MIAKLEYVRRKNSATKNRLINKLTKNQKKMFIFHF